MYEQRLRNNLSAAFLGMAVWRNSAIRYLPGKADQGENCPAVGEGSYSLTAPADPP